MYILTLNWYNWGGSQFSPTYLIHNLIKHFNQKDGRRDGESTTSSKDLSYHIDHEQNNNIFELLPHSAPSWILSKDEILAIRISCGAKKSWISFHCCCCHNPNNNTTSTLWLGWTQNWRCTTNPPHHPTTETQLQPLGTSD